MAARSHSPDPLAAAFRSTQRPPKSCTQCTRRKIRCSKTIPCRQCIHRKLEHLCSREVVNVNGKITIAVDEAYPQISNEESFQLLAEHEVLKRRLLQIESLLTSAGYENPGDFLPQHNSTEQNAPTKPLDGITSFLERFNSNAVSQEADTIRQMLRGLWNTEQQPLLRLLPARHFSTKIVDFALRNLGWMHFALRANVFKEQHEEFWNQVESGDNSALGDHSWVALYLSILATGYHFWVPTRPLKGELYFPGIKKPRSFNERILKSRLWYEVTSIELEMANYTRVADVRTVQTILILNLCNANFGQFQQERISLGIAINVARCLKMDRLGIQGSQSSAVEGFDFYKEWHTDEDRCFGRRLWVSLVVSDWLSRPDETPLSHPSELESALDFASPYCDVLLDCRYLTVQPDLLSPQIYLDELVKLAKISHTYIKGNYRHSRTITQIISELDQALAHLPLPLAIATGEALQTQSRFDAINPWLPLQRAQLHLQIWGLRLEMCKLPEQRFRGSEEAAELYTEMIRSASSIVEIIEQGVPRLPMRSANICQSVIAAGLALALDILYFHLESTPPSNKLAQKSQVEKCIYFFSKQDPQSFLGRYGSITLRRLLNLENLSLQRLLPMRSDKQHTMDRIMMLLSSTDDFSMGYDFSACAWSGNDKEVDLSGNMTSGNAIGSLRADISRSDRQDVRNIAPGSEVLSLGWIDTENVEWEPDIWETFVSSV